MQGSRRYRGIIAVILSSQPRIVAQVMANEFHACPKTAQPCLCQTQKALVQVDPQYVASWKCLQDHLREATGPAP